MSLPDWIEPRLGPQPKDEEQFQRECLAFADHIVAEARRRMTMEGSVLRCKVRVSEVLHQKKSDGSTEQERVKLSAVYDGSEENKQWSKWTPYALFELSISNPHAFGKLSSGHEFYIDFTPASNAPAQA
jgi:hypothetical protein